MERSQINLLIDDALDFFQQMNFRLPEFATYTIAQWQKVKQEAAEIFDLNLGWDVTDFGMGDFDRIGLLLFTLRNGKLGSRDYSKSYAEKIMIAKDGQVTPLHFHHYKMEDIINRGGGDLVIELYHSTPNEDLDYSIITFMIDGLKQSAEAGERIILKPGQSICLPPRLYHKFYADRSRVLIGEVSMVNDDRNDNRFHEPVGRFTSIVENIEPKYLLANEYHKFLQ